MRPLTVATAFHLPALPDTAESAATNNADNQSVRSSTLHPEVLRLCVRSAKCRLLLANAKLILVVTVTSLPKSANCCETWIINRRSPDSASRRVSGAARLSRDQPLPKQQGRYSFCPRNLGSRWAASSSPEAAATSSSATPLPKSRLELSVQFRIGAFATSTPKNWQRGTFVLRVHRECWKHARRRALSSKPFSPWLS